MVEFLQSYGIWIFLGLMVLFMLRARGKGRSGSGMGCCGGHQADPETVPEETPPGHEKNGGCCH